MKLNLEWKSTTAFLLVLLVLIVNAGVSFNNMETVTNNAGWVTHTYKVIVKLEKVLSALKETEALHRSYLLNDNASDLAAYDKSGKDLLGYLADVKELTADNKGQQARIAHLKTEIEDERSRMQRGILLRQTNHAAAVRRSVLQDDAAGRMNKISTDIMAIQAVEQGLLTERQQKAVRSERDMRFTFGAATLGSLILLCLVYGLFSRAIRERNRRRKPLPVARSGSPPPCAA